MASRRTALFAAVIGFCCALLLMSRAVAEDPSTQDRAKQIWQVLDYLAVDYGAAVSDGQIINEDEYAEMQEFSKNAERQISGLPQSSSKANLAQQAGQLRPEIPE